MKLLKKMLFFLVTLIIVVLVILLFAKKNYSFEKTISVKSKSSEVYNFLKFLKNQKKFNHWYLQNNDYTNIFLGEDGTTSAVFKWESDNYYLRSGKQVLKEMNYPESIQIEILTDEPYSIGGTQYFYLSETKGETNITWKIDIHFPFPYNIVMLSDDFEKNLNESMSISFKNLRKELEK
jgi:hypothetical protein